MNTVEHLAAKEAEIFWVGTDENTVLVTSDIMFLIMPDTQLQTEAVVTQSLLRVG